MKTEVTKKETKVIASPNDIKFDYKTGKLITDLLRIVILVLICVLAFSNRLYSILRYESVIHEFDPYFNYRTTTVLVNEGLYKFMNWFDVMSWYPLGRIVGGTVYPGLMLTAGLMHWILNSLNITVNIRNVCVLLAPVFSANCSLAAYLLGKEVTTSGAGLLAAAFMSIVPAYVSRSVAGSYDNEGVAIFALVFTFYLWVKAMKTGSVIWSCLCCLSYFYMVAAWGGYVFITNLIPLNVLVLLLAGKYSYRTYVAYSIFYVLGTLLALQVTFVGFNAIQSSEHFASLGVFGLLQLIGGYKFLQARLSPATFRKTLFILAGIAAAMFAGFLTTTQGQTMILPWTGRMYSMFDPTYAKEHIPIIASVSEHQPTIWASYLFDLNILLLFFPAGLFVAFRNLHNDASIFIICYGVTAIYFAGVMVRLMLTLAPAACVLGGMAVSATLSSFCEISVNSPAEVETEVVEEVSEKTQGKTDKTQIEKKAKQAAKKKAGFWTNSPRVSREISALMILAIFFLMWTYTRHCTWVTAEAYSSPSIVLAGGRGDQRYIMDDFRESYRWLYWNTKPDARVMSWWDYGYQLTAMANRTVLVDNNTWNNTHIATVGKAMSSNETVAYEIMKQLDVDYVLVIFGGVVGYSGDDINKFLWMVRIAAGVYPEIVETDYFTAKGEYRVDHEMSATMRDSLMYKLSYYRFGAIGFDRVRNYEIGFKKVKLTHLEEVYTSEHWLVRIYRVLPPNNRKLE